ncbi:VOC family protein [Enemella sp. A6]|uniref:VOC family protein n=1 Tax=Enemella sp. A6 TaxID=3440152 RepID=UPI003EBE3013
MSEIKGLGYVIVSTAQMERWRVLALEVLDLGEGSGPDPDALYLRMDERAARLIVQPGDEDRVQVIGWEVRDQYALARLRETLVADGCQVTDMSLEEIENRRVEGGFRFTDPSGHPVEIFFGPVLNHDPLCNKYGTRFKTGHLGLGHVVVPITDPVEHDRFYQEVLGFLPRGAYRITPAGVPPVYVRFASTNRRHHTLATLPAGTHSPALVHIMMEVETLDEVGRALDRMHKEGFELSITLGRHTNDHMVSFYVRTPGGWDIEYGCEGMEIDEDYYTSEQISADSYWGHDGSGSSPLAVFTPPAQS